MQLPVVASPSELSVRTDRFGGAVERLTVAVKATLTLAGSGAARLRPPRAFRATDSADGPADVVPYLPGCDVLVIGAASEGVSRLALFRGERALIDKSTSGQPGRTPFGPIEVGPERALLLERRELPTGLTPLAFSVAPPDQRAPYLRGGEMLLVQGLGAPVWCSLPALELECELEIDGRRVELPLYGDLLVVVAAAGQPTATVVFRGSYLSPGRVDKVFIRSGLLGSGGVGEGTLDISAVTRPTEVLPFLAVPPPHEPRAAPSAGTPWHDQPARPVPIAIGEGTLALEDARDLLSLAPHEATHPDSDRVLDSATDSKEAPERPAPPEEPSPTPPADLTPLPVARPELPPLEPLTPEKLEATLLSNGVARDIIARLVDSLRRVAP